MVRFARESAGSRAPGFTSEPERPGRPREFMALMASSAPLRAKDRLREKWEAVGPWDGPRLGERERQVPSKCDVNWDKPLIHERLGLS